MVQEKSKHFLYPNVSPSVDRNSMLLLKHIVSVKKKEKSLKVQNLSVVSMSI